MLLLDAALFIDDMDAFRLTDDLTRSQVPLNERVHFGMLASSEPAFEKLVGKDDGQIALQTQVASLNSR
jgi:hypothetical protein